MAEVPSSASPPRDPLVLRREFVKAVGSAALTSSVPLLGPRRALAAPAGPSPTAPAETAVARFFRMLTAEQRRHLCFPFDHPLRSRVRNNWAIVAPTIGDLREEQRALCRE